MPLPQRLFPAAILSLALLTLALAALFLNGPPFPAAQAQTTTDYDSNDDGLIEISNLAQLNAIRWDLNGDGTADATANNTTYAAAFPNAAAGMGCPDGSDADTTPDPCLGYELKADLTFDTNNDGSVTATDSGGLYWNSGDGWTPLGSRDNPYTGEFQGQGKVISHLFISNDSAAAVGLFGALGADSRVAGLGLSDVSIANSHLSAVGSLAGVNGGTITASYATGNVATTWDSSVAGGLVGLNLWGTVQASFANVAVAAQDEESVVGGLVGQNLLGDIKASYAGGTVSADALQALAGGLVGVNQGTITASYARGAVSASGHNSYGGGLIGHDWGQETDSYWDTAAAGRTVSAGGIGQTSSALQAPTGYTGIYANWNLDLDGVTGGDNPWHFGGGHQYPILVYGTVKSAPQRDYDDDNDRLIEVNSLAQLNAIRWDLNGDGAVASADQANYAAAFPGLTAGMGCPDGNDADTAPDPCLGYELRSDLDFDTDGDGGIDADDGPHWNRSLGWDGIGTSANPFTGAFQGNNKTIANLYVNRTQPARAGLFGEVGSTGKLEQVRLTAVNAHTLDGVRFGPLAGVNGGTIKLSSAVGHVNAVEQNATGYVGGLVGSNTGSITSSYADAEIVGSASVAGGLAGHNSGSGRIVASYSTGVAITARNNAYLGGLVGHNQGALTAIYSRSPVKASGSTAAVGGLVGYNQRTTATSTTQGTITSGYAIGPVVATGTSPSVGGLVGKNSSGVATNSYWETGVSGQSSSALGLGRLDEGSIAVSNTNLNLDGVAGDDNPWVYGGYQYPMLGYGGMDVVRQVRLHIWRDPAVGQSAGTRWDIGNWLTRDLVTRPRAYAWERSDDGVTGWTFVLNRELGIGPTSGASYYFFIEPYAANKRFRVRGRTVERGWVSSPITQAATPWRGPTATLTFSGGHTAPRVGQAIAITGTDNVKWIRCNDTADNGCDVIAAAATSYTPVAADQGKYLYAYRYYDNAQSVKTMGKTAAIGPIAAAAATP